MKTDKQWESRARALIGEVAKHRGLVGTGWQNREAWEGACVAWALQLGREMAAEAAVKQRALDVDLVARAADARAEEIARKCEQISKIDGEAWVSAAELARSTIRKPKEPPSPIVVEFTPQTEAAIRADEREKVAKRIEACEGQWRNVLGEPVMCVATAAAVARAGEPKTREQVLEEALRGLLGDPMLKNLGGVPVDAARRALDWRPDPTT